MTLRAIAHMENTEMKFPRFPHLRTVKFAPVAVFFLFFVTNLTGFYFSPVFAPSAVEARRQDDFIPLDIPLSGDCDLDLIIFRAGEREGVDPRFIHAVIQQESKYDPKDQACNVGAGTKYLAWLLKRFNGDVSLALAGYNAGEGAVDKYKGVPPYHETENYVKKIVANYGKTYHPLLSPADAKIAFRLGNDDSTE